jgi:hypothetical protein
MSFVDERPFRGAEAQIRPGGSRSSLLEENYDENRGNVVSDEKLSAQSGEGSPTGSSEALGFKHDLHRGLKSRQIAMVS